MSLASGLQGYVIGAAGTLGDDVEASLTVSEHGVVAQLGGGAAGAVRCDRAELLAAEGPGRTARSRHATQLVPDATDEPRWSAWRLALAREGYCRAVVAPADVRPGVVIALTLYSRTPEAWPEPSVRAAEALVRLVAGELRLRSDVGADPRADLARRRRAEVTVQRAAGVLMAHEETTAGEAHDALRATARRRGVGIVAAAETVLRSAPPSRRVGEIVERRTAWEDEWPGR
ncbi:ANTAR domain-containing protein [Cellulosimicrobium cellulans]|uniref:ANTAR domain-containing protein n=1 Tax=Cellulosimicrobium cellulans TaxID=1710 RepID=UPI0020969DB9|nr:ANTAR domain-containing protein [Cellulosimicrobium cellulans]MCO7273302.1 ANTAR domain-containing protein [Cellulosimicrobium cellulans]